MAKHFLVEIGEGRLAWSRKADQIEREKILDGIYVVLTSEPAETISGPDAVRTYKSLGNVEKAFRTFKGVDLRVRPIYHRLDERVRTHFLLCMLAYYVEWHMHRALAPLLDAEEDLATDRVECDPVAKTKPTARSERKKATRQSEDGLHLRRRDGRLVALSTQVRNTCEVVEGKVKVPFTRDTQPNAFQSLAFELLEAEAFSGHGLCPVGGTANLSPRPRHLGENQKLVQGGDRGSSLELRFKYKQQPKDRRPRIP